MRSKPRLTTRLGLRYLVVALPCVLLAGEWPGHAEQNTQRRSTATSNRFPQIEVRAPGLFEGRGPTPLNERQVRYQVNATVLVPLFSIPVAHRDDVGFASTAAQDFPAEPGHRIRTYELFSASFPERARGLNRMGFIREAVHMGEKGARWTAHFGALSSNPEVSRREVALDSDESLQSYTVMDGFTDRLHSSNTDTRLELHGSWSSAGFFYRTLIPVWVATEPRRETRSRPHTQVAFMEPLGFLGILQRSLAVASSDVGRASAVRKIRYPFAHKGELMYLALVNHRIDRRRQERYVGEELVAPEAVVHRLDYRILDAEGRLVQPFRVWTELPSAGASRLVAPVFPVEFEFKAKSFLELQAVRDGNSRREYSTAPR